MKLKLEKKEAELLKREMLRKLEAAILRTKQGRGQTQN